MKTQILKIDPEAVPSARIRIIAGFLSREGIIAYPTETYYGLGADCFSPEAIRKIYQLKKRTSSKPLPVIISDIKMAREISLEIPPVFELLAADFWPGPLTLILKASTGLPSELVGATGTLGMRIPAVPWLRELVAEVKHPVIATSANISGEGEIASAERIIQIFMNKVDLIVDGGSTPGLAPSTVVDLTGERPALVRKGAIPRAKLSKYLKSREQASI